MKIGFFLEWMVGSLEPSNKWNVVGEELLSLGWCKELEKLDSTISADVYSYNKLPKEKLDVMIYMNYITKPNYDWADTNIMYIENDFGHNGSEQVVYNTFLKKYKFDAILSFSERIISFLSEKGYKVFYFPFSVDTDIYHPVEYDKKFDYEIAYVGSNIKGTKNNKKYLEPALKFKLGLFGNWNTILQKTISSARILKNKKNFDGYALAMLYRTYCINRRNSLNARLYKTSKGKISQENMIKLLSSSKIMLNVTLPGNKKFDIINYRILEALACKGFVITDYTPSIKKHLKGCVVISKGGKDLENKIKYYLKHPEKRQEIAQRGYEYVQKYYTSKQRASELYEIIKEVS